jgi:DNA-binding NtrC family response regulator
MSTLLVIDDDRSVHYIVNEAFARTSMEIWTARDVRAGLELVKKAPDLVLLDIVLPDVSGLEAFSRIQAIDAKLPVIFITGLSGSDTAIEAMKLGAYDYLLKPLDLPKLRDLVERALEIRRMMNVPVELPREESGSQAGDLLIGRSLPMQAVYKAIGRIAPQNVPVLIHGESGTGKELVARAIYHHSKRAGNRFLAVNCAALPGSELESELFGHEKGASKREEHRPIGKLEQCSEGTLFLDEVDGMSPLVQNKLLRVLQEHEFERVGGSERIHTDVRILAATNRDLKKMVEQETFREDLYYRLHGFTIEVPPLRQRDGDLLLLVQHNLARLNRDSGRNVHSVSPEALDLLMRYPWPGNVRELESAIHQALLRTSGTVILPEFLAEAIRDYNPAAPQVESAADPSSDLAQWVDDCLGSRSQDIYSEVMEMTERYVLTRVLRSTDGNQSQAAKLLGITRGSLRSKIRSLGINLRAAITINGAAAVSNGYDAEAI